MKNSFPAKVTPYAAFDHVTKFGMIFTGPLDGLVDYLENKRGSEGDWIRQCRDEKNESRVLYVWSADGFWKLADEPIPA